MRSKLAHPDAMGPKADEGSVCLLAAIRPHVLVIEDERIWGDPIVKALTLPDVTPAKLEIRDRDIDFGIRFMSPVETDSDRLQLQQFNAELVESGEAALMYSEGDGFDVYIVDLKLQSGSVTEGLALVSAIRKSCPNAGIIVYSGEEAVSTAVPAIAAGANFYLQKPLTAQDLRKATAALWKHHIERQRPRARTFQVGEWRFTFGSRTLINDGDEERRLSSFEYAFLIQLIDAENHEIDRETFARRVFGGETVENDRRLDGLKKRMLGKLGETVQIVQVRDRGYRLIANW